MLITAAVKRGLRSALPRSNSEASMLRHVHALAGAAILQLTDRQGKMSIRADQSFLSFGHAKLPGIISGSMILGGGYLYKKGVDGSKDGQNSNSSSAAAGMPDPDEDPEKKDSNKPEGN